MRFQRVAGLLIASLAWGQAAPSPVPAAATTGPETEVAPDDAVITINGFCPDGPEPSAACKTVITRAQFEKLTDALDPDMPLSVRLKVANAYARNLRMAAAAEKRGLDKTPAFNEEMRYARLQLLSQDLRRALQEDANNISDADLENYYKRNESSFEQATVARIFIPNARQKTSAAVSKADVTPNALQPDAAQKKADQEAMAQLATDLRARAANGEDPDKLQIEAYTAAGIPGTHPNTRMEKVRRENLPPSHEKVMNLRPGETSEVISDPGSAGAHFIYIMISKETLTLDAVKTEIRTQISSQRFRDSLNQFLGDVVYSDTYFNPPSARQATAHRHQKNRKTEQPAQPADERN
ncbi:MAG TPA: hypothetical protein VEH30_06850 [Terriglobales bacterium]|nr:hypothetical protein [Terriglobales bacterium]